MMRYRYAISSGIKRAFVFEGRSTRSEYWLFALLYALPVFCMPLIDGILLSEWISMKVGILGILSLTVFLLTPMVAATWRRLNDIGLPPNLVLLLPVYLTLSGPVVRIIDGLNIAPHHPARYFPEASYAFVGFMGLIALTALICLLPSRQDTDPPTLSPEEVTP